jgi:hypothetical protein
MEPGWCSAVYMGVELQRRYRHAGSLQLNVQTIITDFEDAVLRAGTAVFGRHINHQGCFYHLTQASWRKIQQLGLGHIDG